MNDQSLENPVTEKASTTVVLHHSSERYTSEAPLRAATDSSGAAGG